MKSVFKWKRTQLLFIVFLSVGLLRSSEIKETYSTFQMRTPNFFPEIFQPFQSKPRTLNLITSDSLWNNHFVDPNLNRKSKESVDSIRTIVESGLIEGTFIVQKNHQDAALGVPTIIPINWYKKRALKRNLYHKISELFIKKISGRKTNRRQDSNASFRLLSTNIGNTSVALNIKGSINIDGSVIFQDQESMSLSQREGKSWDLDVNQRQQFDITGTIGDRVSILVNQNSEADFAWENNLRLKYKGNEDDILQSADAGNISLSLPGTQFVGGGSSKSEGLFGVKMIHQLGPLKLTSIMSREQVKQSSRTITGGETSEDYEIQDFNFVYDRYFFLDEFFKNQFYPLNDDYSHTYSNSTVINQYKVYKTTNTGAIEGKAYLDPSDTTSVSISGQWELLERGQDYLINQELGYIHFLISVSNDAVGIGYTIGYKNSEGVIVDYDEIQAVGDYNFQVEFIDENDNGILDPPEDILLGIIGNIIFDTEADGWFDDLNDDGILSEEETIILAGNSEALYDPDAYLIFLDSNGNGVWDDGEEQTEDIVLKLIKQKSPTTQANPTWPLMFKNVYSLGARSIEEEGLEINIIFKNGLNGTETHSTSGNSFLHIFGLDNRDDSDNIVTGGNGKIDIHNNLIDLYNGELFFPSHLPFAFCNSPRIDSTGYPINQFGVPVSNQNEWVYWGNTHSDVEAILDSLSDGNNNFEESEGDDGPAMYYSANDNDHLEGYNFNISVKHSQRSSSIDLGGFMMVEGSEEIRLNGRLLRKGIDYNINYFSGSVNFIDCEECVAPGADIKVTFQENEWLSFDQKVLIGSAAQLDLGDNFKLGAVGMYYNQSIIDEKVDIGYEPVQNFIFDINGDYTRNNVEFLTQAANWLPFVDTNKPSSFHIDGEFAEVIPNPNPLGEAYIDDFESAKRTTTPSIMQRLWKKAAPPIGPEYSIYNRGKMAWYNPYYDVYTKDIWPDLETSTSANNQTTRILLLDSYFQSDSLNLNIWNGITTSFYTSDYNQSESKYCDIWLNTNGISEDDSETFSLHIDIGMISEDLNDNGILDTEDEPFAGSPGNGILDEDEDIGVDGCEDMYEDGWGSCLPEGFSFEYPGENEINPNADPDDPNDDNFQYTEGTDDYSDINGTENNGNLANFAYPDSEDLDGNKSLDNLNDYFSFTLQPLIDEPVSETFTSDGSPTGWKLFRVLLSEFKKIGNGSVQWSDVHHIRLWMNGIAPDAEENVNARLKIAKFELVGNEWQEEGVVQIDDYISNDSFEPASAFGVEVINTVDNAGEYESPPGVQGEYDKINEIMQKEQSLVLSFEPKDGDMHPDSCGIKPQHLVAIKKQLNIASDKAKSFFAYENMEMYVHGEPDPNVNGGPWNDVSGDDNVEFVFQFGREDNYYEIIKPIYTEEDWDERNHININLAELTRMKLGIVAPDEFIQSLHDTGPDSVFSEYENGCFYPDQSPFGGALPDDILSTFTYQDLYNLTSEDSIYFIRDSLIANGLLCTEEHWIEIGCTTCTPEDPNGDDWLNPVTQQTGYGNNQYMEENQNPGIDPQDNIAAIGTENNRKLDYLDLNGIEYHEPFNDNTADGEYSPAPQNYDINSGVYEWTDTLLITDEGIEWQKIRIKGQPSIDRIDYLLVGVRNMTDQMVYGQVFIDELRMTNVKREKGGALRLSGSIKMADLLDISSTFKSEQADFHPLRERLGMGNNTNNFSISTKLNPSLFLPSKWGIKMPLNVTYSNNVSSPKYRSGTDILVGSLAAAPDSIKTISKNLTVSTSFKKTTRSENWWTKYTIDQISLTSLSASYSHSSSVLVKSDISKTYKGTASYAYTFDADNYWEPLKFTSKIPLIGPVLEKTRLYWSPKNWDAKMTLNDIRTVKTQRVGTIDTTTTFKLDRIFGLTYQITKSLKTDYNKTINSNLIGFYDTKLEALRSLSPGMITNTKESLNNSFSPDFLKWLKPKLSYNISYNWKRDSQVDSVRSADIGTSSEFNFNTNFKPKDMIELIYRPTKEAGSSRPPSGRRGRGNSRSNTKKSSIQIKNPILVAILNPLHKLASRITPVSFTYKRSVSHDYGNVVGKPGILFKTGISGDPNLPWYEGGSSSFTHIFKDDITIKSGIALTNNITLTFQNKYNFSKNQQMSGEETINKSLSFLPLGDRGSEGIPFITWNLSWSRFQNYLFLDKIFKTVSLSHVYTGDKNTTVNEGVTQSEDYTRNFSPLIGINTKLIGKFPIDINFNYKYTQTIRNTGAETNRTNATTMSATIKYNHKGGLKIPIFFFRDFNIENDTRFNLTLSYDESQDRYRPGYEGEFDDGNFQKNYSIKPNISYSFTRYVSGDFHFTYSFHDDQTGNTRTTKDIGFSVKIKIQG